MYPSQQIVLEVICVFVYLYGMEDQINGKISTRFMILQIIYVNRWENSIWVSYPPCVLFLLFVPPFISPDFWCFAHVSIIFSSNQN